MKKFLLVYLLISFNNIALGSIKENIINNLIITNNFSFNFEQNINGKVDKGECVIEYPKKIFCKYKNKSNKILVSNGRSLVIKNKNGSYYRYPIKKTPLNFILDKNFLINKINIIDERIVSDKFINFKILKDNNEINIFFDNKNFNLIGWQTIDIYQNLNITYISNLKINQKIKKNTFRLPSPN